MPEMLRCIRISIIITHDFRIWFGNKTSNFHTAGYAEKISKERGLKNDASLKVDLLSPHPTKKSTTQGS